MTTKARCSSSEMNEYICKYDWNCFVQCGKHGKDEWFIEVFPNEPFKYYDHVCGKTIEEAEEKARALYNRYNSCKNHEYEKRGYDNGLGFCKHCGVSNSDAFPKDVCDICNKKEYYTKIDGVKYCEDCVVDGYKEYLRSYSNDKDYLDMLAFCYLKELLFKYKEDVKEIVLLLKPEYQDMAMKRIIEEIDWMLMSAEEQNDALAQGLIAIFETLSESE